MLAVRLARLTLSLAVPPVRVHVRSVRSQPATEPCVTVYGPADWSLSVLVAGSVPSASSSSGNAPTVVANEKSCALSGRESWTTVIEPRRVFVKVQVIWSPDVSAMVAVRVAWSVGWPPVHKSVVSHPVTAPWVTVNVPGFRSLNSRVRGRAPFESSSSENAPSVPL